VELITTLLEMREYPRLQAKGPLRSGMLLRVEEPSVSFYRYLYETVGGGWVWQARRGLSDQELVAIITDQAVDVLVFYSGGVPAGFIELDRRREGEVELVRFGLVPEFRGRALGKWLLAVAVESAWEREPQRLWTAATNLDDPRVLLLCQWAGFIAYDTRREALGDLRV
jgi:GNAT superfamily N-acetyltransferase